MTVTNSDRSPHDPSPPNPTQSLVTDGGGQRSYSDLPKTNRRKKLNILTIILECRNNTVNFNLKKKELARLLFKKMKLDPKDNNKIDTSGYR